MRSRKIVLCLHFDLVVRPCLCFLLDCWGHQVVSSPGSAFGSRRGRSRQTIFSQAMRAESLPSQARPAAVISSSPDYRALRVFVFQEAIALDFDRGHSQRDPDQES